MLTLDFNTTRQSANAFASLLTSDKQPFSPRPYNRFEPEDTMWWVVPNTEWPAYKYGKYIFWNEGKNVFCGLHIEKGFGNEASAGYSNLASKGLILNNEWLWNEFIIAIEKGQIEEQILKIKEVINEEIFIDIGTGLASDPSDYDPNSPKPNKFRFKYNEGGLELIQNKVADENFYSLLDVKEISNLPTIFENIKSLDWYWIDFYITIPFNKRDDKLNDKDLIDEYKLSNILSPFDYWVR